MDTLGLMLSLAVVAGSLAHAQEPPVFRTEVYVVPIDFSMGRTLPFGIRKPVTDLTLEEITVVLDKTTYAPVRLDQDPKRPGHYIVSFTPPDEYRDGAQHLVDVIVKRSSWRTPISMPMTISFPTPSATMNREVFEPHR